MNRRWIAPLAGAAAVAAVIFGFVAVQGDDPSTKPDTPPATSPTGPTGTASPSPSESPSPPEEPSGETRAVPAYFVGDTTHGLRLFREFVPTSVTDSLPAAAVRQAIEGAAKDPDYRSTWPQDTSVHGVAVSADMITVDLGPVALHDRTSFTSEDEARAAIQQVIFTAQAAVGKGRLPVQFLLDGERTDQVLGQPTSEPLANDSVLDTLAQVNITTPAEGAVVSGDTLVVSGVANSFEATVPLRLLQGDKVVWEGFVTAEGCCEEKLFPFSTTVDVSKLAPGTYILEAKTDDPSAGEGPGPFVDTKAIEIR